MLCNALQCFAMLCIRFQVAQQSVVQLELSAGHADAAGVWRTSKLSERLQQIS